MLVTVSFDKNDEKTVMDILLSKERNYKLFCAGSIESIALNFGINCSKCNEIFKEDPSVEMNNDLWVIYASENKSATLELLCVLAETGVTKVQTTSNLCSFFVSKKLECNNCKQQKDSGTILPPPVKMIKMEPPAVNVETTEAEEKVTSTVWNRSGHYDNDDLEEFLIIPDPNEDVLTAISNVAEGSFISIPSSAITPHRVFKTETRKGRTFVENQEGSQNEAPTQSNSRNEIVQDNNGRKVKIENVSDDNSSTKTPSTPVQLYSGCVKKGEEQCKVCNRTLKVSANLDYKVNMTFSMQSHSRVHIAANPFQCRICNYECRFGSMMKTHFRTHHGSVKPTYNDRTSDADYKEENSAMAKKCFPDWVPTNRRDSMIGKGYKRPHDG